MVEESTSPATGNNPHPYGFFNTTDLIRLRYGLWPSENGSACGTILFLPGRAEFLEKYEDTFQALSCRGFDVFGLDWRGQGRSDRLLVDHFKGYVRDFKEYIDDLAQFLEKIVLSRMTPPLIILAHSMGGHIALRFLTENAVVSVSKVVVTAPMLAIFTDPLPPLLAWLISQTAVKFGMGDHISPGRRHNPYQCPWESNRLTSDFDSFKQVMTLVAADPYLNVGAVTYGWLAAAFRSMTHFNRTIERCVPDLPVLVVSAGQDRIVKKNAIKHLIRRLPDCTSVVINGAKHEILQERKELRAQFWRAFDEFTA